ncbi:histidine phosphatase family protein [Pseudomonas sp. MWU16-30317]|uniref:lipopolysaccharide core heptose(II)-phosphate phosphatase PmrG n=1 Tax=Pseudomonas sp. MWU16-30317 TaxID=2878095 RepID=UPI001CFBA7E1|nr:histidine phosphatase family protein [Pseudomonas sp. MWU16-30317]
MEITPVCPYHFCETGALAILPTLAVANKSQWITSVWITRAIFILGLAMVAGAVTLYRMWPLSPLNLSTASPAVRADLLARWKAGNVIVLIRHGERCDYSTHPCMGSADGITWIGNDVAERVGVQLANLGVHDADIFTSPLPRTTQTAQALFHQAITERDWVVRCDANMTADIKAHKVAGRNMLLVTHSGCIRRVDARLGLPHAREAEYASALFLTIGTNGKVKLLGNLDPDDWARMSNTPAAPGN